MTLHLGVGPAAGFANPRHFQSKSAKACEDYTALQAENYTLLQHRSREAHRVTRNHDFVPRRRSLTHPSPRALTSGDTNNIEDAGGDSVLKLATSSGQLNGEWVGRYHTGPVGQAEVHLAFFQLDPESLKQSARGAKAAGLLAAGTEIAVGIFQTNTGAIGTITLEVTGTTFQGVAQQVTPGCPATYQMSGTVENGMMTWTFTGNDCLGNEDGTGEARRIWP